MIPREWDRWALVASRSLLISIWTFSKPHLSFWRRGGAGWRTDANCELPVTDNGLSNHHCNTCPVRLHLGALAHNKSHYSFELILTSHLILLRWHQMLMALRVCVSSKTAGSGLVCWRDCFHTRTEKRSGCYASIGLTCCWQWWIFHKTQTQNVSVCTCLWLTLLNYHSIKSLTAAFIITRWSLDFIWLDDCCMSHSINLY